MYRFRFLVFAAFLSLCSFSQNDVDAIRFSRSSVGVGGSARFVAMGGAFGAIGADPSCAAYNPGGLGLIRKGEISFSGSLRLNDNSGSIYNSSTSSASVMPAFNNFSFAYAWKSSSDPESRNVIAFTNTQLQNYNSSVTMTGYTNSSSIAKDMLNLANQNGDNLNAGYEGLGYQTYLLDKNAASQYVSLLDPKRTVLQSRTLATTGRVNDLNFSYAYSYKDKFYLGASLGVPRVEYTSTTTHSESDTKDSMRVSVDLAHNTYSTTFVDGLPFLNDSAYADKGGFNSLTYTEYFKTTGSGINLKLGGVFRVNDNVRLGFYYHTPTRYSLTDTYYNSLSVTFDQQKTNPYTYQNPVDGTGYFSYKIITPSHIGLNAAFILGTVVVIGVDYEFINYRQAHLSSDSAAIFAGVNALIKDKYREGQNLKVGAELNVKPFMFRAGYNMQGSPFGDVFVGTFVRNTASCGIGFRGKSRWYLDLALTKTFTHEDYYLFTTLDTKARLKYSTSSLIATVGIKF